MVAAMINVSVVTGIDSKDNIGVGGMGAGVVSIGAYVV